MPKVVPSQIVGVIDKIFPAAKDNKSFALSRGSSVECAIITNLVEQLPEELITIIGDEYIELQTALAALKAAIEDWRTRDFPLSTFRGLGFINPISPIRNVLVKCPDEYPSKDTAKLRFIEDESFQLNLENDMSNTVRALSNSEWKAATVLAGSVIEALLLWALEKREQTQLDDAILALLEEGEFDRRPRRGLNNWTFEWYIEVAAKLIIIDKETAELAGLARGYRNLIHPGKEKRKGQKCDRSTAHTAYAAAEGVARDLSLKFEHQ